MAAADVNSLLKQYIAAYLTGHDGTAKTQQIAEQWPTTLCDAESVELILLSSLEHVSRDARRAAVCLLVALSELQRLSLDVISTGFQRFGELDLEDWRLDVPKVGEYVNDLLSQAKRRHLIPKDPFSGDSDVRSWLATAATQLIAQLDARHLEVGDGTADLQHFSIFKPVGFPERERFLNTALEDTVVQRAVGAVVGLAVADSLGAPLEFIPVGTVGHSLSSKTLQYSAVHNADNVQPGQWTDDTSMALCMADSLLVKGGYDGADIRVRFWNWWHRSYNNTFCKETQSKPSFGLGGNVANSLSEIVNSDPPARCASVAEDSGNGSVMRLAPIPVFFSQDIEKAIRSSIESSYTTHPGSTAAMMCGFLGFLICSAIRRGPGPQTAAEFLDICSATYLKRLETSSESRSQGEQVLYKLLSSCESAESLERCWNWRDPDGPFIAETLQARGHSYNGYTVSAGYFGSYSADALAIALHCVYHTCSFMGAVTRCVNFLGDADSTGAVTGQIAGAFYGFTQIDQRCISNLERWDDREVALRAALLCIAGGNMRADAS